MNKYTPKKFNKVAKNKQQLNPVCRFQNLASRLERRTSRGKKK
ncbi:MAG TPA: hypothetical protein P5080_04670 [Candidatus Paceibacterota bacterium]|nr:hypothetical protein [Candidatus Pacearchaeota archaeon]HRZ51244.1 hypothetical protein [Candidatus Paceibacterota bacterium]HSA36966.1 hypothetical protein [Candidatus Paceibacterota bacterium]